MKKQALLIGLAFLVLSCLLAGCGVKQETHDGVVADLSTAQQELQSIQAELDGIQTELEETQTELKATEEELAAEKIELESSPSEVTSLLAEKEALQADYDKLYTRNADLTRELAEINVSYDSVSQELGDLQVVYPPRHFSTLEELKAWVSSNAISDTPVPLGSILSIAGYVRAVEIQEAALRDGYIISVAVYAHTIVPTYGMGGGQCFTKQIYCAASVIDDGIYYWLPDRDDIKPRALIITEIPTWLGDPIQVEPTLEFK